MRPTLAAPLLACAAASVAHGVDPFADGMPAAAVAEQAFARDYGYGAPEGVYAADLAQMAQIQALAQEEQVQQQQQYMMMQQAQQQQQQQMSQQAQQQSRKQARGGGAAAASSPVDLAALQTSLATGKGRYEPEGADPDVAADPYGMTSSSGLSAAGGYQVAGAVMHDPYGAQYTAGPLPTGAPDAYRGMSNAHLGHTGFYCDHRISLHCGFQPKLRGAAPQRFDMAGSDLRTTTGPFSPSQPAAALHAANAAADSRVAWLDRRPAFVFVFVVVVVVVFDDG
jgi:hypothetical protein